jgi:hypothetical protein
MEVCTIARSKCGSANSRLNLFEVPETDFSYMLGDYQKIDPEPISFGGDSALSFAFGRPGSSFYDLSDSFVRILASIEKVDATELTDTDKIAPENLFFHTLWSSIDVTVNGSPLPLSSDYPYTAWINTQLQNGLGEKSSMLSREVYFPGGKFDEFDVAKNPSFKKRLELAKGGKSFEIIGQPMHGIFHTSKFLPPDVKFTLQMSRSRPGFHLSGPQVTGSEGKVTQPYLLNIDAAEMYVRKIVVSPKVQADIRQKFSRRGNAFYPYVHYNVSTVAIPAKSYQFSCSNISDLGGRLPKLLCIGITTREAYNGRVDKSPFNFKPHGLATLKLKLNDTPIIYQQMNFDGEHYMLAYNTLCKLLPSGGGGNDIDYDKFLDGYTIFVFDPQSLYHYGYNANRRGFLGFEVTFSTETTEQLVAVIMSAQEMGMEIGGDGGVGSAEAKFTNY